MNIKTLKQAQEYLYTFRDENNKHSQGGSDFSFDRTEYLAEKLGNPQNNIKVVHIAGTSGKGSTTRILSSLLHAQGFKVGSSISPHLIDMRERFSINDTLLPVETICSYISEISPILEKMRLSSVGHPTYFEITVMLAYYIFYKEGVDYAVMETGMGGRLDATNIARQSNKLAVITRIGLDHTEILGDTVEKIATEKAAIIHPNNMVVVLQQEEGINAVIEKRAQTCNISVNYVVPHKTYFGLRSSLKGSIFNYHYDDLTLSDIELSLKGEYQVENVSIALSVLYELSKRDGFTIDEAATRETLQSITSPGRFEIIDYGEKKIILDGAHNPQKMSAFIESLKTIYPNKKFDFLIGFKRGKDYESMLDLILPLARHMYITEFAKQDGTYMIHPESTGNIEKRIKESGSRVTTESYPHAIDALRIAWNDGSNILVITGSLYLISDLYPTIRGILSH
ncbi:MAG: bifunctional folylpolyglutamate synthase/dihydrofolate synthase [bacterium]|nr:bifunctional folylpolyglutamate synthase/dihydrofolate synthase [bacterium]